MKHKKVLMSLTFVVVLTQAVGIFLNRMVVSVNGGMPTIGLADAFGRWVPLNPGTKLPLLADVIRVGIIDVSVGDLFIIIGMVTIMIAIWIALPQGRKFFPLLIVSILGIFWSEAMANSLASTLLFDTAGIGAVLAMYWKHRRGKKIKAMVKE